MDSKKKSLAENSEADTQQKQTSRSFPAEECCVKDGSRCFTGTAQCNSFGSCATTSKPKCYTENCLISLCGNMERIETDSEVIYCWNLTASNMSSGAFRCVSLSLDIRSYQSNDTFTNGPGIFSGATFTVSAPPELTGTVNMAYAGTGVFYETNSLPPNDWAFTVCASFPLPDASLEYTVVRRSPFSITARRNNYNGNCGGPMQISEQIYVSGDVIQPFTISNEGSGAEIYDTGSSTPLSAQLRTLVAGQNITITGGSNPSEEITIATTAAGVTILNQQEVVAAGDYPSGTEVASFALPVGLTQFYMIGGSVIDPTVTANFVADASLAGTYGLRFSPAGPAGSISPGTFATGNSAGSFATFGFFNVSTAGTLSITYTSSGDYTLGSEVQIVAWSTFPNT